MRSSRKAVFVIFFLKRLGTGKGTQCSALSANHNFIHLSTGEMCREAIEKQTELGKKVEPYIKAKKLVRILVIMTPSSHANRFLTRYPMI
jgi:adenylate kinase family enzyme